MTKLLKYFSVSIAILAILLMLSVLIFSVEQWSVFFALDLQNILIKGTNHSYAFSLADRKGIILILLFFLAFIFGVASYKADRVVEQVKSGVRFLSNYAVDTFKLIKTSNVKYFLLLSFFTTLYLAFFYPLTLDEPMTYYDFIKPPFWHALALYPYPNNHVFSTLLVNLSNEIPGLDLLFRLRLPAVFVSLLTWIFGYRFVRKFYGENVALFVVAVGAFVVTNMQHAYIARGYAFVMFFVVIGFYSAFNIIKNDNRPRDWFAFALSSALGAWTMPSYLYPFLSISLLIFIYNYKHLKTQILYSALVGVLVFLMYSPILIVSGIEALTDNEFVQTVDRLTVVKSLPGFMLGTVVHIFYAPYYIVIAVFALAIAYTLWRRDKPTIVLWLIFGLTPCLFLVLHSVLPFFRTFFYYGFIFTFLFAVSFADLLTRVSARILMISLLCIHLLGIAFFFKISRGLMPEVFQSDDVIKVVLEDNKRYYMDGGISWIQLMNMQFEAERKDFTISVSGDLSAEYDCYLIRKKADTLQKKMEEKGMKSTDMIGIFNTPIVIYSKK